MLKSLKPHSASGPNEIFVWMLCTFPEGIAQSVSALLISPLRKAYYKLIANIVPIRKEPGKQDVHFFPPISIPPVISKVLERHLHNSYWTISIQRACLLMLSLVSTNTAQQLFHYSPHVHKWHQILDKQQNVACIFF